MRGGFVHNRVLVARVAAFFLLLTDRVYLEHPVGSGRHAGFADLFVLFGSHRIVCEAELSADRIHRDVRKAELLEATRLLIVVPRPPLVRAVHRRLAQLAPVRFEIWVGTLGVILKRLSDVFAIKDAVNVRVSSSHQPGTRLIAPDTRQPGEVA